MRSMARRPCSCSTRRLWQEQKSRFVESYLASAAITRATAGSEMTDHRFLTPDRRVQQTTFANGVRVTVNFGDVSFSSDGFTLAPGTVRAENLPADAKPGKGD